MAAQIGALGSDEIEGKLWRSAHLKGLLPSIANTSEPASVQPSPRRVPTPQSLQRSLIRCDKERRCGVRAGKKEPTQTVAVAPNKTDVAGVIREWHFLPINT